MKNTLSNIRKLKWQVKVVILMILVALGYYGYSVSQKSTTTTTYATTTVTKDTFVSTISVSGSISSGNTTNISTKASGTVRAIYVANGDTVKKGQKIMEITLDSDGIEERSSAYANYLKAQENVVGKIKEKNDLEIEVWKNKQAILDAQDDQEYKNSHTTNPSTKQDYTDAEKNQIDLAVTQAKQEFDVTAEKFKNADSAINNARVEASSSFRDYQNVSGIITAPADGIINNLTLTAGSTLTASTTQSTSTGSTFASSQTIGFIRSGSNTYLAKVSLTEADVVKVKAGQRTTLTMDAHMGKTFTGKVLAVDVSGTSSSGVTSYPATIAMDTTELAIYPNMSVSANIILDTQTDVMMLPTTSITNNSNGKNTVQIMKDDETQETREVELGESNDTMTIIKSGLTVGEKVVSSSSTSKKNDNTTSAFSTSTRQTSTNRNGTSGGAVMMGGPGF